MYTHEPTYRDAIKHAWHVVWHHKILWIFGMLSIFIGQFGLGNFFGKVIIMGQKIFSTVGQAPVGFIAYTTQAPSWSQIVAFISLTILILAMVVLVVFMSVTAEGALVYSAASWFKNKKISFKQAWDQGIKHFWNILAINILQKLFLGALLLILMFFWLALSASSGTPGVWNKDLIGISFGLILFFAFIISSVAIYAIGYAVVEDEHIFSAVKKGWRLFSHHALVSVELNLLLLLLGLVLLVVLALGAGIAFAPSLIIWLLGAIFRSVAVIKFGFTVGFALLLVIVVIASAIFNAFATSAWTYLFLKMHEEGVISRFSIWIHHLLGKR